MANSSAFCPSKKLSPPARSNDMDLVEIAPDATPPVCRIGDYGNYRYEPAKRGKESRKHQHATKVNLPKPRAENHHPGVPVPVERASRPQSGGPETDRFGNNPFAQLDING
jgi:hypothetical protein